MKPWPLAVSPFTLADRLKLSWWLVHGPRLTAGSEVRKYEKRWEQYTGCRHAIMVANGSVANELIAERRREQLIKTEEWPQRSHVIFPVCNWVSSVSPWIRLGFTPVWADISSNLCTSTDEISRLLTEDRDGTIGTVFYTTLLGQASYLENMLGICDHHGVALMLDNCESALSWTFEHRGVASRHFCAVATSSTSFYFSHQVTTGTEGGMVFCQSDDDADWFRMMRNHGLTRGMAEKYRNRDVHSAFDFYLAGTNARSSDLQAFMGSMLFERSISFAKERLRLAGLFYDRLDRGKYEDVTQGHRITTPMMALPIMPNPTARYVPGSIIPILDRLQIEHRPIVGGNLLRHTAFKGFGDPRAFPRAEWAHDHGLYVGLHNAVDSEMVQELADELNLA